MAGIVYGQRLDERRLKIDADKVYYPFRNDRERSDRNSHNAGKSGPICFILPGIREVVYVNLLTR